MSNQYRTYMKREIRKTYPLLIVGIVFLAFMGMLAASMTNGLYEGALLEMSDHFTEHIAWEMGETGIWRICIYLLYDGNLCICGNAFAADIFTREPKRNC